MGRSSIGPRLALAAADIVAAVLTVVLLGVSSTICAQTTAGIGTTIVFPITAQTTSFASEVTLFNPGPNALSASVKFYEANNSATPGLKTCAEVAVASNRSAQIKLSTQCTLTAASHFGVLVIADKASPQSNNFYGYMRVQNPQGIGFSIEGFPLQNFNNQVSHAMGLIRQAAAPSYQTNCFVGSLDQPVSYSVKLFNGFSGSQIGSTVTGSLTAFQQVRYLDIFGSSGVNAPAGDQFNVRAEFAQTSGGSANLIGFCTVQDNTSFGADFRVAKSYGSPSGTFYAQGGNAFGTTATLGTTDNQPLNIIVNGGRVMHYEQTATSPNIIGGFVNNGVYLGVVGSTIAGGGAAGTTHPQAGTCPYAFACINGVTDHFGTIGGGLANLVGDTDGNATNNPFGTVAGGFGNAANGYASVGGGYGNVASGFKSTVGGGTQNTASGGGSTVPGGQINTAAGAGSFAAGSVASALYQGEFVWADTSSFFDFEPGSANHGWVGLAAANTFNVRATGGIWLVTGVTAFGEPTSFVFVNPGSGTWGGLSDRASKENLLEIDQRDILAKVTAMPLSTWNYIAEGKHVRHMGPMSQDFSEAFGLGPNDKTITHLDEAGVALAAIQGLNLLLQEKDARIAALERRLQRIEDALAQGAPGNDRVATSQR